jgi:hypothetical protein
VPAAAGTERNAPADHRAARLQGEYRMVTPG